MTNNTENTTGNGDNFGYYQKFYNMFGGSNPLVDKHVKTLHRFGMLTGIAMLGSTFMQYLFALILNLSGQMKLYQTDAIFQNGVSVVLQVFSLFLPFFAVMLMCRPSERKSAMAFNKPNSGQSFVLAVFAGLMICALADAATTFLQGLYSIVGISASQAVDDIIRADSVIGKLLFTVNCAVMPALLEEFAFRGVIMQPLRRYGDRFAIVLSSFVFAMMHGNIIQIPFAFMAGIALGYFCIKTESIWTSVAIHFLNNLKSVIITTVFMENESTAVSVLYYAVSAAFFVIGVVALVVFSINNQTKLKKDGSGIEVMYKRAAFMSAPTMVLSIAFALYNALCVFINVKSGIGVFLLLGVLGFASFLFIKWVTILRRDNQIDQTGSFRTSLSFSLVMTVIATFAGTFLIITSPFRIS